jgi:hypothetical protein
MTTVFSYPYRNFSEDIGNITISTGPVVVNKNRDKVLLHLSSTTGKYQFIWWRLDDTLSPRDNALIRAREVIATTSISLLENNPLILLDTIIRDGKEEKLLLIHYEATIENEAMIWDAIWMNLEEIQTVELSSPNVMIASKFFLGK